MSCGYCGELFPSEVGAENIKNKPKVLNCEHILCSNCLSAQIRTLPEENLVMIVCPFCAEPTVKEIPAEVSDSLQDLSRCSSYDSDTSMTNVDTTPIDFQHSNRTSLNYEGDFFLDRSGIRPLQLSEFDEMNQSTNLDMPTYDGIYEAKDHINDSTELDQDNTVNTNDSNYQQIEHSTYIDRVQIEVSEIESFAHWTLIVMDLSILLYVIVDVLGGINELAQRGMFYMHASVSVQNMAYGLLLLHLFLQEMPNSSLSQSYALLQEASGAGQSSRHVNAHVAALLMVLDLCAVLALFLSANRRSVSLICRICLQELQNMVTTGTICVFGVSIIVLASTFVLSMVLTVVLVFQSVAQKSEDTLSAPHNLKRTSPFAKSPIDPNTTEIDEHTRQILRRHSLSSTRSPNITLNRNLHIDISATSGDAAATTPSYTVRTGVYSPRHYSPRTHSTSNNNNACRNAYSPSDVNTTGHRNTSIPSTDSDESVHVTHSRSDDWAVDGHPEEDIEAECNFDDIYAHSDDDKDGSDTAVLQASLHLAENLSTRIHSSHYSPHHQRESDQKLDELLSVISVQSPVAEKNVDSTVDPMGNIEEVPEEESIADDGEEKDDETQLNVAIKNNLGTISIDKLNDPTSGNNNSISSPKTHTVVGESSVYSPLQPLRIADLSLSPLSPERITHSSTHNTVETSVMNILNREDATVHSCSEEVEVPNIRHPLSNPLQLPPLPLSALIEPHPEPLTTIPSTITTTTTAITSLPSLPLSSLAPATLVRSHRKKGHKPWRSGYAQQHGSTITSDTTQDSTEVDNGSDVLLNTVTPSVVRKKKKYPLDSPQSVRALRKSVLEHATHSNASSSGNSATNSASDNSLGIPSDASIPSELPTNTAHSSTELAIVEGVRPSSRKTGRTTPDPEGIKKLKVRTPELVSYSQLYEHRLSSGSVVSEGEVAPSAVVVSGDEAVDRLDNRSALVVAEEVHPVIETSTNGHDSVLCITTTLPSTDAYSDSDDSCSSNSTYNSTSNDNHKNVRTVRLPNKRSRVLQTQQVYPEPVDMSNLSMDVSINTLAYGKSHHICAQPSKIVDHEDNLCNTTDVSVSVHPNTSCVDYSNMDDLVSPTLVASYRNPALSDTIGNTHHTESALQTDLLTHINSTIPPAAVGTTDTMTYNLTVDKNSESTDGYATFLSTTDDGTSNIDNTMGTIPLISLESAVTPAPAPLIPSPRRTVAFNAIAQAYIDKISGTCSNNSVETDGIAVGQVDITEEAPSEATTDATATITAVDGGTEPHVADSDAISVASSTSRHTHIRAYSLGTTLLLKSADDIDTMFETLAHDVEVINHTIHVHDETSVAISNTGTNEGTAVNSVEDDAKDVEDSDLPIEISLVEAETNLEEDEFIYPDLSTSIPAAALVESPFEKPDTDDNAQDDIAVPISPFTAPNTPTANHTLLHNNTNSNKNTLSPEMSGLDLSRIYPIQDECMYDRNDIPDPVNDVFETYSDARLTTADGGVADNTKSKSKDKELERKPSGTSNMNVLPVLNPLVTKRSAANIVYSPYNYTAQLADTTAPSTKVPQINTASTSTSTPATTFTPIATSHSASMYSIGSTTSSYSANNNNSAPRSRSNIRASIRERIDLRLGKTPQPRISSSTSTDNPAISVTTPTLNTTADVDRFENEMQVFNSYATNSSTYNGMNSGGSLGRNTLSCTQSMDHKDSPSLGPNSEFSPTNSSSSNRKEMVSTSTCPMKPNSKHVEREDGVLSHTIDPAELGDYMPSKTLNPSLLRYHQQQQQYQQHQHASQVDLLNRNTNSVELGSHTSVAMAIVAEMQEEVSTSPPIKLNADVEHHSTHTTPNTSKNLMRPTQSMYSEAGSSVTDSNVSSTASSMYDLSSVRNVTSPYNFDPTPVRAPTPVYTNNIPNVLSSGSLPVSGVKATPPATITASNPNSNNISGILKNMAAQSFYTHYTSNNNTGVTGSSNMVRPSPLLRPATGLSTNQHTLNTHSTQPIGSPALRKHASMNSNNITNALSASKNAASLRAKGTNSTSTSAVNTPNTGTSTNERGLVHSASNYSLASNKSRGASSLDCVSDAMDSSSSYVLVLHMNQALTTHRCIGKIAKCIAAVVVKCQERNCPVVVLVSLPSPNSSGGGSGVGTVNAVYSYLYAVPNSRATAYDLHSTEAVEYIVKVRSKPCWLIPPIDTTNSPMRNSTTTTSSSIILTERMFRSTLSALVNLDTSTRSSTAPHSSTHSSIYGKHGVVGGNSPYSPDVDPRVLYENHLNGLRNEIKTALGVFTGTSDVVVVCDGTCWPFQSPPHIANQSAALSNWLLYRTSVPYLQFHFVAISTISTGGSVSGSKSMDSK